MEIRKEHSKKQQVLFILRVGLLFLMTFSFSGTRASEEDKTFVTPKRLLMTLPFLEACSPLKSVKNMVLEWGDTIRPFNLAEKFITNLGPFEWENNQYHMKECGFYSNKAGRRNWSLYDYLKDYLQRPNNSKVKEFKFIETKTDQSPIFRLELCAENAKEGKIFTYVLLDILLASPAPLYLPTISTDFLKACISLEQVKNHSKGKNLSVFHFKGKIYLLDKYHFSCATLGTLQESASHYLTYLCHINKDLTFKSVDGKIFVLDLTNEDQTEKIFLRLRCEE